eukprot:647701-Rhodomonas_salina.2
MLCQYRAGSSIASASVPRRSIAEGYLVGHAAYQVLRPAPGSSIADVSTADCVANAWASTEDSEANA